MTTIPAISLLSLPHTNSYEIDRSFTWEPESARESVKPAATEQRQWEEGLEAVPREPSYEEKIVTAEDNAEAIEGVRQRVHDSKTSVFPWQGVKLKEGLPKEDEHLLKKAILAKMDRENLCAEPQRLNEGHPSRNLAFEADDNVPDMQASRPAPGSRRPDLSVSIPSKPRQSARRRPRTVATPVSAVSTPSTTTSSKTKKNTGSSTGNHVLAVSPLSTVEMPKFRRPVAARSLEGIREHSQRSPGNLPRSATTVSSDDYSQPGIKSSGRLSRHSSMSSIESVEVDSDEISIRSDEAEASVLYHAALGTPSRNSRAISVAYPGSRASAFRLQGNAASLQSAAVNMDRNKPLPPEPVPRHGVPSTASRHVSQLMPHEPIARVSGGDGLVKTLNITRSNSKNKALHAPASKKTTSLRSKFTPKTAEVVEPELTKAQEDTTYSNGGLRRDQASAPDSLLHTIREDAHNEAGDPVRDGSVAYGIRRTFDPSAESSPLNGQPRPYVVRATSMEHLSPQRRREYLGPQRASTMVGSSSKADKILGKGDVDGARSAANRQSIDTATQEDDFDEYPDVSVSLPPSRPGGFARRADAEFEMIRRRMELLSPKEDSTATFQEIHHQHNPEVAQSRTQDHSQQHLERRHSPQVKTERYIQPFLPRSARYSLKKSSPVELEGSQAYYLPVELPLPSPAIPELKASPVLRSRDRRGRAESLAAAENIARKTQSLHSQRSTKARSLASLAASDIPDLYAEMQASRRKASQPQMTEEEMEHLISADAAERVLLRILESLDNLKDLFSAAEISRGFYRTFKRHELHLLRNALWQMSPAAYELREMSVPFNELEPGCIDYHPNMYLKHYVQDLLTMVEMKALILDHCKSFLRHDTISGLAGETERSPLIDNAFWRVWTFCRVFGCDNNREDDIVGQMDWLRGGMMAKQQRAKSFAVTMTDGMAMNSVLFNPPKDFASGNGDGLTAAEQYDMMEIWTCLGVLLQGYIGRRDEARKFGVFNGAEIAPGDVEKENAALEEWAYHLLTLGPQTVLEVVAPTTLTKKAFQTVQSRGYTNWKTPSDGSSRSTFLKEAVSRVYEEKVFAERRSLSRSSSSTTNVPAGSDLSTRLGSNNSSSTGLSPRQRRLAHAAELRAQRRTPTAYIQRSSEERPMSDYPNVLARLEALGTSQPSAPPVPKVPSFATKLSSWMPKVSATPPSRSSGRSKMSTPTATSSRASSPVWAAHTHRFSSFREKMSKSASRPRSRESIDVQGPSFAELASVGFRPSVLLEKFLVDDSQSMKAGVTGPHVPDSFEMALERLISMGYDEDRARLALEESDRGNGVNLDKALKTLIKEKKRRERLERLDRMG